LAKQYGPLMYLQLGSVNTLVASSPAMAKEFLKNQDHVFQYRPPLLLVQIVGNNWTFGVISGSTWRFVKRLCSNGLFKMKQLQSFQPLRMKEIQETIKDIYLEAQEGKVVDVNTKLTSFSTNHMTQILFGKRYCGVGTYQKEAQWFKEINAAILHWAGAFIVADYIPYLKWVTKLQGITASLQRLQIQVSSFIPKIIDEHRNAPLTANASIHDRAKDFVDVLIATRGENGIGYLSNEAIQDIIMDMLLGGIGTIVGTLEWAMAELLLQPNIMKHAQKELDNLVGTNRLVEESDLHDLPYIQAILKETFRLHPPAPFLAPHHSIEACQVQGYTIPANTRVIVNVWAIGRDPNSWENPLKFDPDRFMKHPEIDVQGQDFSLLPFGSGRRGCPGRSLGMLVVQIMLAKLLQSFDWSLPNNQHHLDMSERFGLDLKKAEALCAMAHPRLPSHFYH
jgi:cytochrome P450